jgi:Polysaccharide lyase/PKD domain
MNPKKKNYLRNKSMFALLVSGVVFFASCKKDNSIQEMNTSAATATPVAVTKSSTETASVSASAARTGNTSPNARAGADQSITLPVSTVNLDGSGSNDPDGSIRSYAWSKEVGPSATIASASSATTAVTGLTAGEYRFKLIVTDNGSATASDTLHVSVKGTGGSTPANPAPVVNAGNAQTITLPVSSVTLSGSATDANGTVVSYLWTKTSGTGGMITNPNAATTTVTGLTAGSYVFDLKATDNGGASASKTVTITVNSGSTTPPPTGGNYGTLVYSTGYNTVNDLDPYGNGQWGSGTLASHLSTTIYKDGPGAFKSDPASVSAGIRSEVQYPSTLTATEGVIEYDVMYSTIFQNSGHSLQFHPNTSGGSASPGLWHENGKFVWVNWKGGTNTKYPTNFTIPQNKWMHVVFEYKFGSAGYMKFTIDGVVVLNATNIQVGDGSGQYLKVGVNMWATQSSLVYYDNLKIWKK